MPCTLNLLIFVIQETLFLFHNYIEVTIAGKSTSIII